MKLIQLVVLTLLTTKVEDIFGKCVRDPNDCTNVNCDDLNDLPLLSNRECVIRRLTISSYHKSQISDNKSLKILNLNENNISTIKDGIFNNLTFLKVLDLSYNSINIIEVQSFDKMNRLQYLYFHHNSMRDIKYGIFNNLTSLINLDLSYNSINIIEVQSFDNMNRLQYLDLHHNSMRDIKYGIFNNLTSLIYLDLSYNSINIIEVHAFDNIIKLQHLDLDHNSMRDIKYGIFNNLTSLISLDLSYNSINIIEVQSFDKMNRLQYLSFHHNSMRDIKYGIFNNLTSLINLEVSHNSIDTIYKNSFQGMNQIKNLDISNNKLYHLKNFTFNGSQIQTINFQNNNIEKIDLKAFFGIKSLDTLHLNQNKLKYFTIGCFFHLTNLKVLDLSNNYITQLSYGLIAPLPTLYTLNISYNYLTNLNGLLHAKVTILDITYNKIKNLQSSTLFAKLLTIQDISVEGNIWTCDSLHIFITDLHHRNVNVEIGNTVSETNINGIACTENQVTEQTNKNNTHSNLEEMLNSTDTKNTPFYNYLDKDLFLSKVYKYIELFKSLQEQQNNISMVQNTALAKYLNQESKKQFDIKDEFHSFREILENTMESIPPKNTSSSLLEAVSKVEAEDRTTPVLPILSFLVLLAILGLLTFVIFFVKRKSTFQFDQVQMT